MRYNQLDVNTEKKIVFLFESGLLPSEIAKQLDKYHRTICRVLKRNMSEDKYIKIKKENKNNKSKGKRMLDTQDLLNNNRVILAEIAEKIRENKPEELSNEHLIYAKLLYKNGFINEKGEVTDEGKKALYQ